MLKIAHTKCCSKSCGWPSSLELKRSALVVKVLWWLNISLHGQYLPYVSRYGLYCKSVRFINILLFYFFMYCTTVPTLIILYSFLQGYK